MEDEWIEKPEHHETRARQPDKDKPVPPSATEPAVGRSKTDSQTGREPDKTDGRARITGSTFTS